MGNLISSWRKLFAKKQGRLLLIGLDAAGKTSILNRLAHNEVKETAPTIGFNCENIEYKNISFTAWDIGGQDKIRALWRHYYTNTSAIIYVIDSTDKERLELAAEELFKVLEHEDLKSVPLLIYANKQDCQNCLSPSKIVQDMNLSKIKDKTWLIQGCSAKTGNGVLDGLDFIAKQIE